MKSILRRPSGLPIGILIGVIVLFYVAKNKGSPISGGAMIFLIYPMLVTFAFAALANITFWFATGTTPRAESFGTNSKNKKPIFEFLNVNALMSVYRWLQFFSMVGGGYISLSPIIAVFFLE